MNKTVGAVTTQGFDPAYLNVTADGQFPEKLKVTLRGDKTVGTDQQTVVGTFTKEEFALFLVRCSQAL